MPGWWELALRENRMAKVKPGELWQKCSELLFERSDRWGPLNEAMRAAVVVAVDGHKLVVGLAGGTP